VHNQLQDLAKKRFKISLDELPEPEHRVAVASSSRSAFTRLRSTRRLIRPRAIVVAHFLQRRRANMEPLERRTYRQARATMEAAVGRATAQAGCLTVCMSEQGRAHKAAQSQASGAQMGLAAAPRKRSKETAHSSPTQHPRACRALRRRDPQKRFPQAVRQTSRRKFLVIESSIP